MFIHPYIQQKYFLIMRKYRDGRQNASSFCANIVTADRVPDATGWNTLTADKVRDAMEWNTMTADRVQYTTAEILSRLTEYFRNLRKNQDGRKSMRCDRMENYNGRQSTRCDRMEYYNGRQSSCYDGRCTLAAVGVFKALNVSTDGRKRRLVLSRKI